MRIAAHYALTLHSTSTSTVGRMDITLLYFEDCPNWQVADERLTAPTAERPRHRRHPAVGRDARGGRTGRFHGSLSVLVDGVDVLADGDTGIGLSFRRCLTPAGPAGAPTSEQFRAAAMGA
jgi:hypothetical protein